MIIAIDARFSGIQHGGVGVFTDELISALVKIAKNHIIQLYTYHNSALTSLLDDNIRIISTSKVVSHGFWSQFILPVLIKKNNPDVFLSLISSFPLALSVPKIVTIYDVSWNLVPERYSLISRWKHKVWYKLAIRSSASIITISKKIEDKIKSHFSNNEKLVKIIYPGVNSVFFKIFKISKKVTPYFISVGGASLPRKYFEITVEAIRLLREQNNEDVVLFLTGNIHEQYKPLVEKYSWIEYKGIVSVEKLAHFYADSIALLFSSPFEGFGIPVAEAFAARTAVIACNIPAVEEIFFDCVLKVNTFSVQEIFNACKRLLNDENFRDLLAEKGYQLAKKLLWTKSAQTLLDVVEAIK